MISLLAKPQNGTTATQEMYRRRLEKVLRNEEEAPDCGPAASLDLCEAPMECAESLEDGDPAAVADGQTSGQAPAPTDDSAQSGQNGGSSIEGVELGQAARQIADTLVGTLGKAIQEVHQRVGTDHAKLEATSETMTRLAGRVHQASTEISSFSARVEALALEQADLGSRITDLDHRMSDEELGSRLAQERQEKLFAGQEAITQQIQACTGTISALEARIVQLCGRVETLDAGLQAQTASGARLVSLCEKLDELHRSLAERVDFHEELIHALRAEVRQPMGMLERILGSLRAVDLRRESRLPVDEPVSVTIEGQPETPVTGRVVDVSDNGFGLELEKPLRPAAEVRIEVNNTSFAGKVAYCLPKGEKHAVGLKLSQPLRGRGKSSEHAV